MTPTPDPTPEQIEAASKIVGHVFHGCPTECGRCAKVDEMAAILAAWDAAHAREVAEWQAREQRAHDEMRAYKDQVGDSATSTMMLVALRTRAEQAEAALAAWNRRTPSIRETALEAVADAAKNRHSKECGCVDHVGGMVGCPVGIALKKLSALKAEIGRKA